MREFFEIVFTDHGTIRIGWFWIIVILTVFYILFKKDNSNGK